MVWQVIRCIGVLAMVLGDASRGVAAKSATIGVAAELLPACVAGNSQGGQQVFGTLDLGTHFSLDAAVTAIGQVGAGALLINCMAGTPYQVLISAGSSGSVANRTLLGPAAATIQYNLYTSANHLQVWDDSIGVSGIGNGQDQWLPVFAQVPAQQPLAAGVYSDTLTVTVSW